MVRNALVVDDSMLIRHTVCRFLEAKNIKVEAASNGVEAMKILNDFTPDLIITDLSMPQMSGSELISEIKSSKRLASVPIVVLAARRVVSDTQKIETRANFVVHKDIDIDEQLGKARDAVSAGMAVRD